MLSPKACDVLMIISKRFLQCALDLKASFNLASYWLAIRATTNRNPLISPNNEEEENDEDNNWKALCMYVSYAVPAD